MARFGKDTKRFPMNSWARHGQHLTTVPKVLVDKVKAGQKVTGTFEIVYVGKDSDGNDKFKLILERE